MNNADRCVEFERVLSSCKIDRALLDAGRHERLRMRHVFRLARCVRLLRTGARQMCVTARVRDIVVRSV
jgi:hypothetical protein